MRSWLAILRSAGQARLPRSWHGHEWIVLSGFVCMGFGTALWPISAPAETPARLKVGMVSDTARFDDAGFNQSCKEGLERAVRQFKVEACFRESKSREDYNKNLMELAEQGCGMIIGVGYLMHKDMAAVAGKNPGIKFALIDSAFFPPMPNVQSLTFNVDEAAFPAGFLAAAWADLKDPKDAKVGYVGGVKIESVEQFIVPYQAGVAYYNKKHGKQVQVKGDYAGSFDDLPKGKTMAEALISDGVDVIFGVGGQTGVGALIAAKEKGRWGIGVDVDQYATLPEVKDILLTSCLKKLDHAVFSLVQAVLAGQFQGGGNVVGTLANGQVGLAPYHGLDTHIPDRIKKDLTDIQQLIRSGKIATGWPPSYIIPW